VSEAVKAHAPFGITDDSEACGEIEYRLEHNADRDGVLTLDASKSVAEMELVLDPMAGDIAGEYTATLIGELP
jgi:hypothetical protein